MDHPAGRAGGAEDQAPIGPRARRALAFAVSVAVTVAAAAPALAQGEHPRRLAAELAVMSGDLQRLAAAADPPHQLQGLRARLAGALSSLPLLIRQAGGASDSAQMNALRSALARDDWKTLRAGLEGLLKHHPLDLGGILPVAATPQRLALGAAIHRQACAACHDHPSAQAQLPAHELFKQAIDMPPEEFAARLLNGVRGDPSTGQRNPFGALEIGALIAYYRCGADRIAVHRAQGSNGAMKDCEGRAP